MPHPDSSAKNLANNPSLREPRPRMNAAASGSSARPNFLVVGAAKAGTTSLHEFLGQHPQIFMSANKEPHYFVHGYGVKEWDQYLALFEGVTTQKAVGESSTLYLCCEESAEWIKSTLGEIKIIIILREPARRAFSLYGWMVREGYEDAETFAEALRREPARLAAPEFRKNSLQFFLDYLYFQTGLYSGQVRRFLEIFGREHVKIFLFEDFTKRPLEVCREIFQFLGVDDQFTPRVSVQNEGRMPRSISVQHALRSHRLGLQFVPRPWRRRLARKLMRLNLRWGKKPELDRPAYEELRGRYADDVRALETLLNLDLARWRGENVKP